MAQLDEARKQKLVKFLEQGNLFGVIEAYMDNPEVRKLEILRTGETALHIAVSESALWESYAEKMVSDAATDVLKMVNWQGDTALHLAAKFGNTYLCKLIAEKDPAACLIQLKNDSGETPLFSAVSRGNTQAFLYLHHFSKAKNCSDYGSCTRDNGDTILHSAISGQFFDLAYIIIKEYPELVHVVNNDKLSPLHLLADEPSYFQSGLQLSGIRKLVYHCVCVPSLAKIEDLSKAPNPEPQPGWKGAQSKMKKKLKFEWEKMQHEATNKRGHGGIVQKDEEAAHQQGSVGWMGCIQALLVLLACGSILAVVYAFVGVGYACLGVWYAFGLLPKWVKYILRYEEYERAKRMKRRCIWSEEVMSKLIEEAPKQERIPPNKKDDEAPKQEGILPNKKEDEPDIINETPKQERIPPNKKEDEPPDTPKQCQCQCHLCIKEESICSAEVKNKDNIPKQELPDTPLLIAAKNGISEMVKGILDRNLEAIHDVNAKGKNIVMLAVEHRHPRLYDYLWENFRYKKTIFERVDKSGNSLLHLAADLESGKQFWRIRGAALHMQMEIKWYKHIKKSMPAGFFVRHNNNKETAKEIFRRTHKCLIEEGRQWLISTSQSCSVVAALIATVAFATSTTVPGGLNQDTGLPTLVNNPVFIISATSSLIALSSSMISVVMFLSILTSSFKRKDFRKDLPKKLRRGLVALLMSIVSMCISFWTGHYFVLKPELNQYAPLVYVLGFPVVAFIISKFPLDFKIVWTTLSEKPLK